MPEKGLHREKSIPGSCFFLIEGNYSVWMRLPVLLSLRCVTTEAKQGRVPIFLDGLQTATASVASNEHEALGKQLHFGPIELFSLPPSKVDAQPCPQKSPV